MSFFDRQYQCPLYPKHVSYPRYESVSTMSTGLPIQHWNISHRDSSHVTPHSSSYNHGNINNQIATLVSLHRTCISYYTPWLVPVIKEFLDHIKIKHRLYMINIILEYRLCFKRIGLQLINLDHQIIEHLQEFQSAANLWKYTVICLVIKGTG